MTITRFAHQEAEWTGHRYDAARAYLWQQRTGKTRMAVESATALFQALEIGGVLVVAPNGVHRQWANEQVARWSDHVLPFAWRLANPNNVVMFNVFMATANRMRGAWLPWLCINMESLIREDTRKAIATFKKAVGRAMLIVDESHHFGRPGAKRTAVGRGLARQFEYRRILTGTPVENSPLQAFSQFELLEREALGHRTYGSFKAEHAVTEMMPGPGGRRFPKVVGYRNLDALREKMARYSSVVLRRDCEDLPPVMTVQRAVELGARQRRMWDAIKNQMLEELDEMKYAGPISGGAAFVKLQQVEGGFLLGPDGAESLCPDDNPKMSILLDEIEQYDGRVIVWFQYIHELEAAYAALTLAKIRCGRFHGRVRPAERDRTLGDLAAGRIRVLLGQPQAGGEGRDMSAAGMIVWYSQTPDARLRSQAAERATAMGGKKVQMIDLVAPGGVDAHFSRLAARKAGVADDVGREGLRKVLLEMSI